MPRPPRDQHESGRMPGLRPGWAPAAFYGVGGPALAVLLILVMTGTFRNEREIEALAGPAMLGFDLTALVFGLVAALRPQLDRRTRRAWALITMATALLLAASVAYHSFPARSFPAPGDIFRLAFVPVMLLGLLSLPRQARGQLSRHKVLLDVGTTVVAGAMVMWYLVVGPVLAQYAGQAGTVAAAASFPIGDLVLLFGIALVLTQGVDESARRPMLLMATALLSEIVGNTYLGYMRAHLVFEDAHGWQFCCWLLGHALVAAAAFEQSRSASLVLTAAQRMRPANRLPYLSILLGCALLVAAAVREAQAYPWLGLVLGAVILTAIVVGRQLVALHENYHMAVTDGLTGLANRSYLHEALDRALARGVRNRDRVGVLLADLNGFKEINDTLGHAAGDRLLIEFAGMLRRSVLGGDVAGRLGGDEFAVVLHDIGSYANAEAVARRLRRETEQPTMIGDTLVQIRAAIGIAISEPGDSDVDDIFDRADEAMYRDKRATKGGPADDEHHPMAASQD